MPLNPLIHFALGLANVPDKDVDDLERTLPEMAALCKLAKQLKPLVDEMVPLVEKLLPLYKEAAPTITQLMPLVTQAMTIYESQSKAVSDVIPVVQEFVDFLNGRA